MFNRDEWILEQQNPMISLKKWQTTVDLVAKLYEAPAVYIIQSTSKGYQVVIGNQNANNPYRSGELFAKDMKMDWRIGAAYFESLLVDYDVHSNYGNWMYVSGVGNDPRDRKFDVQWQAERYDPNRKFQNLWLQKTLF